LHAEPDSREDQKKQEGKNIEKFAHESGTRLTPNDVGGNGTGVGGGRAFLKEGEVYC